MRLRRGSDGSGRLITLVPLVDAMLILLVFFLVTSTYLDLDRLPLSRTETEVPAGSPAAEAEVLLVRLTRDGVAVVGGRPVADLEAAARAALGPDALRPVLLFPAPGAKVQALVTAMEALTRAGAPAIRVVRTEAP